MSRPVVYAVTDRQGRVLSRMTSSRPLTHACVAMRWDGRASVQGWGDRATAHASKERALRQIENRAAVVVATVIERRPLR